MALEKDFQFMETQRQRTWGGGGGGGGGLNPPPPPHFLRHFSFRVSQLERFYGIWSFASPPFTFHYY